MSRTEHLDNPAAVTIEWKLLAPDSLPEYGIPCLVRLGGHAHATVNGFSFENSTTELKVTRPNTVVAVLCGRTDGFGTTVPQFWAIMGFNEPDHKRRTGYTPCTTGRIALTDVKSWAMFNG